MQPAINIQGAKHQGKEPIVCSTQGWPIGSVLRKPVPLRPPELSRRVVVSEMRRAAMDLVWRKTMFCGFVASKGFCKHNWIAFSQFVLQRRSKHKNQITVDLS